MSPDSLSQRMPIDQFHDCPRRLGWKHEYFDGALQLSPSSTAVVSFKLDVASFPSRRGAHDAEGATSISARRPRPADAEELTELFHQSFVGAAEYAGWPADSYRAEAERNIIRFFDGSPRNRLEASVVFIESEKISAAALIKQRAKGPLLEPIFVAPQRQRSGIGSALLERVVQRLAAAGDAILFSRCHLGNPASLSWHGKLGFEEIPDLFAARHRAYHYQWEAERLERLKQEGAAEARQQAEYWWLEVDRLESLGEENLGPTPE